MKLTADHLMILREMAAGAPLRFMPRGLSHPHEHGNWLPHEFDDGSFDFDLDAAMRDLWLGRRNLSADPEHGAMFEFSILQDLIDECLIIEEREDDIGVLRYELTNRGRAYGRIDCHSNPAAEPKLRGAA